MNKMSRRQFIKLVATASGVVFLSPTLAGCSEKQPENVAEAQPTLPGTTGQPAASPTINAPNQTAKPIETSDPAEAKPSPSPEPEIKPTEKAQPVVNNPDLVVARNGEPEDLVKRALAALGGMEKFVKNGANVIIKPNICTDYYPFEYAATTNPWVISALVKLCLLSGAKRVQVMDSPFGGSAQSAYKNSGIQEQVEAAGGEMVLMPDFKFSDTKIPEGKDIRNWIVFEDILNADTVINVPIAKHHSLARLTLGMKNLMGVVQNRGGLHRNLGQRLADLTSLIRPTLTVVDSVRILTSNGPTGGSLDYVKKLDTIIASPDIVAADSYAATLFDMNPEDISYIRAGAEMGLGRMDLGNLIIAEA